MRTFVIPLLVASALAGCLGGASGDPALDEAPSVDGGDESPLGTAGTEDRPVGVPLSDPWAGNVTELVLFEGTLMAQATNEWTCLAQGATTGGEPPCYALVPTSGPFVPLGTATLRVEADGTAALKAGTWLATLRTSLRLQPPDTMGEATREPVHTWRFPVVAQEWDAPWWARTQVAVDLRPYQDGVLDGPIEVRVVAERDPAWVAPVMGDPFAQRDVHAMPQPGVITLLAADGHAEEGLGGDFALEPLADRVPPGTSAVVVGMRWSPVAGCAFALETCFLRVDGRWAGRTVAPWTEPVDESTATHFVKTYTVPDVFVSDHSALAMSLVTFEKYIIRRCPLVPEGFGCAPGPVSTDYHVLVEAWRDEVDLESFTVRLGVS